SSALCAVPTRRSSDLAVLAVEQLGGNDDGRVRIQQLHLERHDREVALLEADHALGGHARALATWGAPDHAATQDTVAEVEGAARSEEHTSELQSRFDL